jgi:hypothetical protein
MQVRMRGIIALCKDLETSYSRIDIAEVMSFARPPSSCVEVMSLALILFKGTKFKVDWPQIKLHIIGNVNNYMNYNNQ